MNVLVVRLLNKRHNLSADRQSLKVSQKYHNFGLVALLASLFLCSSATAQRVLEGRVLNAETEEPLAFASISVVGKRYGTVSNADGFFTFRLPAGIKNDTLMCSYIGFDTYRQVLTAVPEDEELIIRLAPTSLVLEEVVITPRDPEDYIRAAVDQIPENYLNERYRTIGYYSDYLKENDTYLSNVELIFEMNTPGYTADTTEKSQVRLLQGRIREDLGEMQFRKEKREEESFDISSIFDGPASVIQLDPVRDLDTFLKEEYFNKFRYTLETPVTYQGRTLLVIRFQQKRKIDRQKVNGKVYIDLRTNAFVAIEYDGYAKIPLLARPILFAMGIGIDKPTFSKITRFRQLNDRWVVDNVLVEVDLEVTDKHMFKKNEHFHYKLESIFAATDVTVENVTDFPESECFDPDEDLEEQFPPRNDALWQQYNIVRPRRLEKR